MKKHRRYRRNPAPLANYLYFTGALLVGRAAVNKVATCCTRFAFLGSAKPAVAAGVLLGLGYLAQEKLPPSIGYALATALAVNFVGQVAAVMGASPFAVAAPGVAPVLPVATGGCGCS
jgi:hypothetical protein